MTKNIAQKISNKKGSVTFLCKIHRFATRGAKSFDSHLRGINKNFPQISHD